MATNKSLRNLHGRKRVRSGHPENLNQLVRKIMRRGEEIKLFDNGISLTPGTTQTITEITQLIVQGITANTRIGSTIRARKLILRYAWNMATAATFSSFVRIIVFRDRENRGVVPNAQDIVTNGNTTALYALPVVTERRIIILYDKMHSMSINGERVGLGSRVINLDFDIFYNGTTGTATDNGKNSLWVMVWGSDNTQPAGFNSDFELQYTDA